ncbi:MBOAT family O-acyltransferase [Paenibacillus sp. FSL F4-0125]|uniref:MBOAT family O-acyltransferase n=1 Tax=Paenibacillus sp. FSL F4-0125 TaxID=2954730 RepID=UPI0030F8C534
MVITLLIGGFWHGAGLMFILWGLLHGVGQAVEKIWGRWGFTFPSGSHGYSPSSS